MARDEFPVAIKEILYKRVGGQCSNPSCDKHTFAPKVDGNAAASIGVAAHITAASLGGPRFNPQLSPAERSSAENGIWLCQNCAKLIDSDTERFDVLTIRTWKSGAENRALARVSGTDAKPEEHGDSRWRVSSMTNQSAAAESCLEFLRLENLHAGWESMPAYFDAARVMTDESGVRIGWDIISIDLEKFENIGSILMDFGGNSAAIKRRQQLGHHWLAIVAQVGNVTENEKLANSVQRYCSELNSRYRLRVLIGYMAGTRFVDHVFTSA